MFSWYGQYLCSQFTRVVFWVVVVEQVLDRYIYTLPELERLRCARLWSENLVPVAVEQTFVRVYVGPVLPRPQASATSSLIRGFVNNFKFSSGILRDLMVAGSS